MLDAELIAKQESHQIWMSFQDKFDLTFDLYNYADFFELLIHRTCKDAID